MTKKEKNIFLIISFLVSFQGIIYFGIKYFFTVQTQFGLRPHPLTPSQLHLHIILVPFLVLAFGYLLGQHILPKLKSNNSNRKISGVTSLVLFLLMIFSGYLLQLGFSVEASKVVGYIHSAIALIWMAAIIWHARLVNKTT